MFPLALDSHGLVNSHFYAHINATVVGIVRKRHELTTCVMYSRESMEERKPSTVGKLAEFLAAS